MANSTERPIAIAAPSQAPPASDSLVRYAPTVEVACNFLDWRGAPRAGHRHTLDSVDHHLGGVILEDGAFWRLEGAGDFFGGAGAAWLDRDGRHPQQQHE